MVSPSFASLIISHIIREQIESLDETVDDNFGNEGEVYKMDEDDEA